MNDNPNDHSEKRIEIPLVGIFQAKYLDGGDIYCYKFGEKFEGYYVDYVIYKKKNGKCYNEKDKEFISKKIVSFRKLARQSVILGVSEIRELCKECGIKNDMTDEQISSNVIFQNFKIYWSGKCESYCKPSEIDRDHNIVLSFDENMKLKYASFDG